MYLSLCRTKEEVDVTKEYTKHSENGDGLQVKVTSDKYFTE